MSYCKKGWISQNSNIVDVCFATIYFSTAEFCIEDGSGIIVLCAFFKNNLEIQINVMDRGESSRFECKLCFGWYLTLQQPQIFNIFLITKLWIKPQCMCITKLHTALQNAPDSKVHGAHIGPIWGLTGSRWAPCQLGSMNFAIRGIIHWEWQFSQT